MNRGHYAASWNWRRESIILGLIAMEAMWLTALFLALVQPAAAGQPIYTAMGVIVLLLLPAYLARGLSYLQVAARVQWVVMTACLLLAMALVWRLALIPSAGEGVRLRLNYDLVMGLLLVLAAWWRGNTLAHMEIASPNVVLVHFWIGLSVFLLVIILGEALLGQPSVVEPQADVPVPMSRVLGFIPAYFLFSLVTLSIARIEEVIQLPESMASAPRPRLWLSVIGGAAILVVAVGWLLSLFFTGGGLAWSLSWVGPLLTVLSQVLRFIGVLLVALLAALFSLLVPLFEWLVSWLPFQRLREIANQLLENFQQFERLMRDMEETRAAGDLWGTIAKYALVLVFVLAVLLAGRAVRQRRRRQKVLVFDQTADISGRLDTGREANLLQRGLGRLADRLQDGLRFLHALSIRRVYANLCRFAARKGYPRSPQQTPHEYQELLVEVMPDDQADVVMITQAYVRAHYGQVPDSREELALIREAWRRIRASA